MDERLKDNMRFLCDESRMLTGVTVAYARLFTANGRSMAARRS